MAKRAIDDLTVAEIMSRWPPTISVFIAYNLLCIGCPIAIFHTLADAAREHHADPVGLSEAIGAAISRSTAGRASVRRR